MAEDDARLVSRWRHGDEDAASAVFDRYVSRLVALAQKKLSPQLSRRIDPEDVVQSAMRSFFVRAKDGQFDLEQHGDLWRLLATITLNKLHRQVAANRRQKRSYLREESFVETASEPVVSHEAYDRDPTPDEIAAATEEVTELMRKLKPATRRVLQLRLQGYTLSEIAAETGRSERTIRRVISELKQLLVRRAIENQSPASES